MKTNFKLWHQDINSVYAADVDSCTNIGKPEIIQLAPTAPIN